MYAITLHQPWATFMAYGLKWCETRSWRPYRDVMPTLQKHGLLIHAASAFNKKMRAICYHPPYREALEHLEMTVEDLPTGAIVAMCKVIRVLPTYEVDEISIADFSDSSFEYELGDYSPGRFFWVCREMQRPRQVIKASGFQKLWQFNLFEHEEAQNDSFWLPVNSEERSLPLVVPTPVPEQLKLL